MSHVQNPPSHPDRKIISGNLVADLHNGDCLSIMARIPDKSVHLMICDLPYGITRCEWDRKLNLQIFWKEVERVLTPLGSVLMFGCQPFTSELVQSKVDWFKYELIWKKSRPTGFQQCWQRPLIEHENILVFSPGVIVGRHRSSRQMTYNPQGLIQLPHPRRRKSERRAGHWGDQVLKGAEQIWTNHPRSVLEAPSVQKGVHPTQKPEALIRYLVRTFSNSGDVVCDPTMGSGSSGVAAITEQRNFIGIELDAQYFVISDHRIMKAIGATMSASAPDEDIAAA